MLFTLRGYINSLEMKVIFEVIDTNTKQFIYSTNTKQLLLKNFIHIRKRGEIKRNRNDLFMFVSLASFLFHIFAPKMAPQLFLPEKRLQQQNCGIKYTDNFNPFSLFGIYGNGAHAGLPVIIRLVFNSTNSSNNNNIEDEN